MRYLRFGLCLGAVLLVLTAGSLARAQEFALSALDMALAGDADAVVRLETRRFVVEGPGEATEHVRRVVTVLRPEGREAGVLALGYGRFHEIDKLEGIVRDGRGKVIGRLGDENIRDLSAISGFSLYEESRVRVAELYHSTYPYTVEYVFERTYDGLIGWPSWSPHWRGAPVEQARFEIVAPADVAVRYATRHFDAEPVIERGGGRTTYRWAVSDRPEIEQEPMGPPRAEQLPTVYTAPARFEIEGRPGSMNSWASFGGWMHGLYAGRAELPAGAKQEVQRLIAGASTTREKARRLYDYLQDRTRYVSVQLGIGGWQPFDAAYVHARRYGDCKALTNYMLALLRAAGIEAYPALIRTGIGEPAILPDFPSNQFNHAILAVPITDEGASADTLWLETTSQTIPFGHIGPGSEGRHVLLVTPDGGRLVRTPRSRASANRQQRRATVRVQASGDAVAVVQTTYTGNQQDRVRGALARASERERRRWLRRAVRLSTFEVVAADFSEAASKALAVTLPVELEIRRYASPTASRLFLPLNLMERWADVPPPAELRAQPVHAAPYAFADTDSVSYELPEGYVVEAAPDPVVVEAPFGRYEARVEQPASGTLVYRRELTLTDPVLPPSQYAAYRLFVQQVVRADQMQAVLVKAP